MSAFVPPIQGPNAFLTRVAGALSPGDALDAGMGAGRNALWLAAHGWRVAGFDPDEAAIRTARRRAAEAGLHLDAHVLTSRAFDWGPGCYDLIVFCYGGQPRRAAPLACGALRPGGVVIVEAFHRDAAAGQRIGERVLFDDGELRGLFAGLEVLVDQRIQTLPDFGTTPLPLVRFVGRKPGGPLQIV